MKKHILYIATIVAGTFITTPVFATTIDTNVNIRPSMTLSVSSNDINLNLNPATKPFDTKDLTITIGTNNPTGYKLYLTSDSTNLVNTEDNTKTIETLPSSTPASGYDEASFPANYWGYRKSNGSSSSGNYLPFSSNLLVSSSTGPSNETTTSIGLASKIDYLKESGTYSLDFKLNAVPLVTNYTMQELGTNSTLAQTVCTENPTVVVDSRDDQTYTISKLKDGNCWMTQNLKLGKYTDSLTLTSADSDINGGTYILNNKSTDGAFTENYATQYYCSDEYSCFYNWFTATAGTGTETIVSGDTDSTICPKGWTLPALSNFIELANYYNENTSGEMLVSQASSIHENINGLSKPGFVLNGYYDASGRVSRYDGMGTYWAHDAASSTYAYRCDFWSTNIAGLNNSVGKVRNGRSVRCILKES